MREELEQDAAFNADHGKKGRGIRLGGEYPQTQLVLDVRSDGLP